MNQRGARVSGRPRDSARTRPGVQPLQPGRGRTAERAVPGSPGQPVPRGGHGPQPTIWSPENRCIRDPGRRALLWRGSGHPDPPGSSPGAPSVAASLPAPRLEGLSPPVAQAARRGIPVHRPRSWRDSSHHPRAPRSHGRSRRPSQGMSTAARACSIDRPRIVHRAAWAGSRGRPSERRKATSWAVRWRSAHRALGRQEAALPNRFTYGSSSAVK
jgi:hypothetical protein